MEVCPPEVVELIVKELQVVDVLNLRLCSRTIHSLASQETFKSFYKTKRVYLRKACLEDFVDFVECETVGHLLETLVLVGEAIDTRELEKKVRMERKDRHWIDGVSMCTEVQRSAGELLEATKWRQGLNDLGMLRAEQQEALDVPTAHPNLLTAAFQYLKRHDRFRSLSLDVSVLTEDSSLRQRPMETGSWRLIWKEASRTWNVASIALARSGLALESLDVFYEPARCSLSCRALGETDFDDDRLAQCFSKIKSLSMNVSEKIVGDLVSRADPKTMSDPLRNGADLIGIQKILSIMPALEQLQIRWYNTHQNHKRSQALFFEHLSEATHVRSLKSCVLRGIYATETALLRFLQSTSLTSLVMENVTVRSGTFGPVFEYCTSQCATLQHLCLDDLREGGPESHKLIFFDESPAPKFPVRWHPANLPRRGTKLERHGLELKQSIKYSFPAWDPVGSPWFYDWVKYRRRYFGPPNVV